MFSCESGEAIFKQGGPGDAFYIIYEGEVVISVKKGILGLGFAKQVATLKAGDFFGEMALLAREKRGGTAVASGPVKLFALTEVDFGSILRGNPSFADEVQKIAQRRKFLSSH